MTELERIPGQWFEEPRIEGLPSRGTSPQLETTKEPQLRQEEARDERGRFLKGWSGNPGGRPKSDLRRLVEAIAQEPHPAGDGSWTYHDEIARQLVTRAAAGEEPYFSAYLNRVYPIIRRVESDNRVTAVKSWVEIVREFDERDQSGQLTE